MLTVTAPKRTFGLRFLSLLALLVGGAVLAAAPPVPSDNIVSSLSSLHLLDLRSAASDDGLWSTVVKDDDPDSPDDDDGDDSPDALTVAAPIVADTSFELETPHSSDAQTPIQRAADLRALRAPPQ